ncbi:FMN-dependent NADH-azoreductase [Gottfriedia sp. NPDC056225]|uniref:FMN-dependent NADH-azoreductase n=1 Tax=Gottfriedia sp. NPDC056225 TaxID=3345751 RepID=UPI001558A67D|nr:FMN-dependent NADH-azoreductase [Arthrobacter citreus]
MNRILVINAHPNFNSEEVYSVNVLNHFKETLKNMDPTPEIEQINLYNEEIPNVDSTVLSAWKKLSEGIQLNSDEARKIERMNEILKQFKEIKQYVIALPLHNFNIPSKLKDYMDNILIARETFKYTENGSVGLLNDGRKLLLIQASGAIYTNDDWYTEVEYAHKYLKSMFNFLGVEDYQIIRAQGTALLKREEILANAYKEAEDAAKRFAI